MKEYIEREALVEHSEDYGVGLGEKKAAPDSAVTKQMVRKLIKKARRYTDEN